MTRIPTLSALVVAVVMTLSGCGIASQAVSAANSAASSVAAAADVPSAQTLWTSAKKSMAAATSAHLKGTVTTAASSVDMEIAGSRDGTNSKMISTTNGATGEVITLGDVQYIKGNAAFWKASGGTDALVAKIGSMYVKAPTDKATGAKSIGEEIDAMAGATFNVVDMFTFSVEKADLGGTATYLMSKSKAGTYDLKIWIAADGTGNLLRVQQTGSDSIDFTFSEWNAVAPWTAPPTDQVFQP